MLRTWSENENGLASGLRGVSIALATIEGSSKATYAGFLRRGLARHRLRYAAAVVRRLHPPVRGSDAPRTSAQSCTAPTTVTERAGQPGG